MNDSMEIYEVGEYPSDLDLAMPSIEAPTMTPTNSFLDEQAPADLNYLPGEVAENVQLVESADEIIPADDEESSLEGDDLDLQDVPLQEDIQYRDVFRSAFIDPDVVLSSDSEEEPECDDFIEMMVYEKYRMEKYTRRYEVDGDEKVFNKAIQAAADLSLMESYLTEEEQDIWEEVNYVDDKSSLAFIAGSSIPLQREIAKINKIAAYSENKVDRQVAYEQFLKDKKSTHVGKMADYQTQIDAAARMADELDYELNGLEDPNNEANTMIRDGRARFGYLTQMRVNNYLIDNPVAPEIREPRQWGSPIVSSAIRRLAAARKTDHGRVGAAPIPAVVRRTAPPPPIVDHAAVARRETARRVAAARNSYRAASSPPAIPQRASRPAARPRVDPEVTARRQHADRVAAARNTYRNRSVPAAGRHNVTLPARSRPRSASASPLRPRVDPVAEARQQRAQRIVEARNTYRNPVARPAAVGERLNRTLPARRPPAPVVNPVVEARQRIIAARNAYRNPAARVAAGGLPPRRRVRPSPRARALVAEVIAPQPDPRQEAINRRREARRHFAAPAVRNAAVAQVVRPNPRVVAARRAAPPAPEVQRQERINRLRATTRRYRAVSREGAHVQAVPQPNQLAQRVIQQAAQQNRQQADAAQQRVRTRNLYRSRAVRNAYADAPLPAAPQIVRNAVATAAVEANTQTDRTEALVSARKKYAKKENRPMPKVTRPPPRGMKMDNPEESRPLNSTRLSELFNKRKPDNAASLSSTQNAADIEKNLPDLDASVIMSPRRARDPELSIIAEDLTAENDALLEVLQEQDKEIEELEERLRVSDTHVKDLEDLLFQKFEELADLQEVCDNAIANSGDKTIAEAYDKLDEKEFEVLELEAKLEAANEAKDEVDKKKHETTIDNLNEKVQTVKKLVADLKV